VTRVAALDAGTSYHAVALGGRYAPLIDVRLYVPELARHDLAAFAAVIVTCRTPPDLLVEHGARLRGYLAGGGMLVVMGETAPDRWLPGVRLTPCETDWWWWLEPGADLGLEIADPDHPLLRRLALADATWHLHGTIDPPDGARSVIEARGGSILYDDEVSTPGRLVVTTLDPFYHHGSFFMPATTRFLDAFLPWVREAAGERTAPR
jgi:hypothetical protein